MRKKIKPSDAYVNCLYEFEKSVNQCINVSQNCSGISSPTGSHYYASVLFTLLCTRSVSLLKLLPRYIDENYIKNPWDYGSVLSLVRSILEIRLTFFYLGSEEIDNDEWECRWLIMCIHDCAGRVKLFSSMPTDVHDSEYHNQGFNSQISELQERVSKNLFFHNLPPGRKRHFLEGKEAYILPLEEIAVRTGATADNFRLIYRFLSSHVHAFPFSFFRMDKGNRGTGIHSDLEERYIINGLEISIQLLEGARLEMLDKFEGLVNHT